MIGQTSDYIVTFVILSGLLEKNRSSCVLEHFVILVGPFISCSRWYLSLRAFVCTIPVRANLQTVSTRF